MFVAAVSPFAKQIAVEDAGWIVEAGTVRGGRWAATSYCGRVAGTRDATQPEGCDARVDPVVAMLCACDSVIPPQIKISVITSTTKGLKTCGFKRMCFITAPEYLLCDARHAGGRASVFEFCDGVNSFPIYVRRTLETMIARLHVNWCVLVNASSD